MIYETIGKNIKFFRKELKMTQSELADLLFISPQMVSRYENNIAAPDIATVAKICSIFHISMDILCGLESTSKDKRINDLYEKYTQKMQGDFSALRKNYEDFLLDVADIMNDDRVMKMQLSLLANLHDHIENEKHHQEINEKLFDCASRILDISQDEELRSYANFRMAIYFNETPFEHENYQKNLNLSKEYMRKVLMCTYFPKYTPLIGIDFRSEMYAKVQMDNIDFFANKLYFAIQQLLRKESEDDLSVKYHALLGCLIDFLDQ